MKTLTSLSLLVWTLAFAQLGQAEPEKLIFGMSTALSGPTRDLGQNMELGVRLAFQRFNSAGGINGQEIKLIVEDDGYEPDRTAPNMHKLISVDHVLGVIGNVGTPTAVVAIPIANAAHVAFFAAFTGAGILRKDPPDRYVINYRASYAEETATMVDGLISKVGLKPDEIAFFTQRDGYGDAGYSGGIEALKNHGLSGEHQVVHARYERNTLAVENALADIMSAPKPPKAVIMVGTYAPCAKFIKLAHENGLEALFLNVSFVGSESLARELGQQGEGVVVTQVVPPPDSKSEISEEFLSDLKRFAPGNNFTLGAFEGYIAARVLTKALSSSKQKIDRESVINLLENLGSFDLGGVELSLSPAKHQASNKVWLTEISSGQIVSSDWKKIASRINLK